MASNEEKLGKFNLAINHYAQEQRDKIEHEVFEYKKRELEAAEVDVLTEAYRLIQNEMAEMRDRITREMAHREMDARKELLAKRQKITDEVFQKAAERLLAYTQTEKYAPMLEKSARELASVFQKPGTVLCIRPEDKKYEEIIRKAFGGDCVFHAADDIKIGGIRAYHAETGLMADETLDSELEEQREWFEENCGMAVV